MKIAVRGSESALAAALNEARRAQPTITLDRGSPAHHFHEVQVRVRLGEGENCFAAARGEVMTFSMHRRSGLAVLASEPVARPGVDVISALPVGLLMVLVPCRVLEIWDERDRAGFSYVTLPGHPEIGVEAFVVERAADDSVWFSISAISRPGSIVTVLAGPVGRAIQRLATDRYVAAMKDACN